MNSSPRDDVNDRSSCDGDSSYCRLAALQCDDVGNDFISSMLRFMCRLDIAFVYALNKFRIYAVLIGAFNDTFTFVSLVLNDLRRYCLVSFR